MHVTRRPRIGNTSYDGLHCFFIGLLCCFLEAVILIIHNSHQSTEAGNDAGKMFEARISSIPSHDTGRAYPGGFN